MAEFPEKVRLEAKRLSAFKCCYCHERPGDDVHHIHPQKDGGSNDIGCFRHQLLLPHPYLVLTKPLRLDIQCQRAASVKIGWKYLDN